MLAERVGVAPPQSLGHLLPRSPAGRTQSQLTIPTHSITTRDRALVIRDGLLRPLLDMLINVVMDIEVIILMQ